MSAFAAAIHALQFSGDEDEANIAAVLEEIAAFHDDMGDTCPCGMANPCPEYVRGQQLALLWIGRGADRVAAHARSVISRRRSA